MKREVKLTAHRKKLKLERILLFIMGTILGLGVLSSEVRHAVWQEFQSLRLEFDSEFFLNMVEEPEGSPGYELLCRYFTKPTGKQILFQEIYQQVVAPNVGRIPLEAAQVKFWFFTAHTPRLCMEARSVDMYRDIFDGRVDDEINPSLFKFIQYLDGQEFTIEGWNIQFPEKKIYLCELFKIQE